MTIFTNVFKEQKAFVGYITAGHGGIDFTEEAAVALVKGGVNLLEIGMPFSDPIADGPVIQEAMTDALGREINLQDVFHAIKRIKQACDVPIVLFTYLNPLIAAGLDKTLRDAAASGVSGILIVDLPIEEAAVYADICSSYGVELIYLISPSTSIDRIADIDSRCRSFLYYVCRNGTTGIKNTLPDDYKKNMAAIKSCAKNPVVSGFGIGDAVIAEQVLQHADGFVVGSAFVKAISEGADASDLQSLAAELDPRCAIR